MASVSTEAMGAEVDDAEIAAFCRRHHVARFAFLGTLLRDDVGPGGDIDVLVEFEPRHTQGYIGLAGMEIELGETLGREAHIHTVAGLSKSLGSDTVISAADWRYGAP